MSIFFYFLTDGMLFASSQVITKHIFKENNMSENMRYFGLCMNCKNASSCTFPRDPARQSFYCEEFEIDTITSTLSLKKEQSLARGTDTNDKDSMKFIGLCSDCEGRRKCTFPKPEGGVWRCEEYQ